MADTCTCGVIHLNGVCPLLARVRKLLGEGARIGTNAQWPDAPLHVGTYVRGEWKMFGAGTTWDEALANVKKVKFQRGNGRFVYEGEE